MKKAIKNIFSVPLIVLRLLKKSKIDNFVGGLIFGAIFSLFVNVVTVQFQELINGQRYYEALEQELIGQFQDAGRTLTAIKKYDSGEIDELFLTSFPSRYRDDLWNEGNAIAYIQKLSPESQAALSVHYSMSLGFANGIIEEYRNLYDELSKVYILCLAEKSEADCESIKKAKNKQFVELQNAHSSAATFINDSYIEVRKRFHPTQDRLESPILSLVMGREAIGILIKSKTEGDLDELKVDPDFGFGTE